MSSNNFTTITPGTFSPVVGASNTNLTNNPLSNTSTTPSSSIFASPVMLVSGSGQTHSDQRDKAVAVDPTALPVTDHDDEDDEEEEIHVGRHADYAVGNNHKLPLYVIKSAMKISAIIEWFIKEGGGVMVEEGKPVTENSIGPIRVVFSRLKKGKGVGVFRQTHFSLAMLGQAVYDRLIAKGHGYDPATAPKGIVADFQICKFTFEAKRYPYSWKKHTGRDDIHTSKPKDISFFLQLPNHMDVAEIQRQINFYLQQAVKFGLIIADSYSTLILMKNREGNNGQHSGIAELKFDLTKLTIEQVIGMMSMLESNQWVEKKKTSTDFLRMNVSWNRTTLTKGVSNKKKSLKPRHDESFSQEEQSVPEEVKVGVHSTEFPTLPGQSLQQPRQGKKGRKPHFTTQPQQQHQQTSVQNHIELPVSPVAQPVAPANPMTMMSQMITSGNAGQMDTNAMLQLLTLQMLSQMSSQMNQRK